MVDGGWWMVDGGWIMGFRWMHTFSLLSAVTYRLVFSSGQGEEIIGARFRLAMPLKS
jgi:hypothetical protein